jgi:hypothetical protein
MAESNEGKGFVKAVQNNDMTYRFVKVIEEGKGAIYVREDLASADFVRSISDQPVPSRYVRPVGGIVNIVESEPVLMVPFIGTSGTALYTTTTLGQKVVGVRQYIRPIKDYLPLILRAISFTRELSARGIPFITVVIGYGKNNKPRFLILRGARYFVRKYRSRKTGELRTYPDLRLFFTKPLFGGFKKGERYYFVLSVLVPKGALANAQPRKTFVVPVEPEPKGTESAPEATAQQAQASTVQEIDRQLKELFEYLRKVSP